MFSALKQAIKSQRSAHELQANVLAGLTVGIIALPLSMALAIATGVPPQHGLYTAVIAGAVIALTGGSRFQVSGPTAAFVVILAPIAAIVTNVDPEHLDHFKTFDAVKESFQTFVENVPFYGFAVMCTDHPIVQRLVGRIEDRRIITYGENP